MLAAQRLPVMTPRFAVYYFLRANNEVTLHLTLEAYGEDPNLTELIQRLIRTYYRGDADKKAHLIGFLIGADPGE